MKRKLSKAGKKWKDLLERAEVKGTHPVERMYALMNYAKSLEASARFEAMDCHTAIMDFALEGGEMAHQALFSLGMNAEIGANQERLGIA